jgi:hypothetical protein
MAASYPILAGANMKCGPPWQSSFLSSSLHARTQRRLYPESKPGKMGLMHHDRTRNRLLLRAALLAFLALSACAEGTQEAQLTAHETAQALALDADASAEAANEAEALEIADEETAQPEAATEPATAALASCRSVQIFSIAAGKFVSAEYGYPSNDPRWGMLRARSNTVGPWEKWEICPDGAAGWALRSHYSKRWVSCERDYPGVGARMLRARATSIGVWERFNRTTSRFGWDLLHNQVQSGTVAVEVGYTGNDKGMLRARTAVDGPWEQLFIQEVVPW